MVFTLMITNTVVACASVELCLVKQIFTRGNIQLAFFEAPFSRKSRDLACFAVIGLFIWLQHVQRSSIYFGKVKKTAVLRCVLMSLFLYGEKYVLNIRLESSKFGVFGL